MAGLKFKGGIKMKVEILPYPKEKGFIVVFPSAQNQEKINEILATVMTDLIEKKYIPKPTKIFNCEKNGDPYFLIIPRKEQAGLLNDLTISLDQALKKQKKYLKGVEK
jgi:hypothetical protein